MSNAADVVRVLRRAREILTPEGAWVQMMTACNAAGRLCFAFEDEAVSFCLSGALGRAAYKESMVRYLELVDAARDELADWGKSEGLFRSEDLTAWNDAHGRTQEEVLALLDAVIALGALGEKEAA